MAVWSAGSDGHGTNRDVTNVIEPVHGRGVHVLRSRGKLYLGAGAGGRAHSIRLAVDEVSSPGAVVPAASRFPINPSERTVPYAHCSIATGW